MQNVLTAGALGALGTAAYADGAIDTRTINRSRATGTRLHHTQSREIKRRLRQLAAGIITPSRFEQRLSDVLRGPFVSDGARIPVPSAHETPAIPAPLAEVETPQPGANVPDVETPAAPAVEKVKGVKASKAETPPPAAADDEAINAEVTKKQKNIGKTVTWSAFGKSLEGQIFAVIPPGKTPRDLGHEAGSKTAKPRDHISYVVKQSDEALVWPVFGSLTVKK